jgi:hypothetical protein
MAKTSPTQRTLKHLRECARCGKVLAEATHPNRKYCSLACKRRSIYDKRGYRHLHKKSCELCGKSFAPFRKSNRFCSRKCGVRGRSGNRRAHRILCICRFCGKEYGVTSSIAGTTKYCSSRCSNAGRNLSGRKNPNWKGGISFEKYPAAFNSRLKARMRAKYGYRCQFCGIHENKCDRKLDLHHVDYDKENCDDSNLITLCRGCNVLANYYNRQLWTMVYGEMIRLHSIGFVMR